MQKEDSIKGGKKFQISITGREHNTWQGDIIESERTIPFSSELELIFLIEGLLEQSSKYSKEIIE